MQKLEYQEVLDKLTDMQFVVLKNIYQYRYLSYEQVMRLTYLKDSVNTTQAKKSTTRLLNTLIRYECIDETEVSNTTAYSLKQRGVNALLDHNFIEAEMFDVERNEVIRAYYRPHELEMGINLLPHHLALNEFVIDWKAMYEDLNLTKSCEYKDERGVSRSYLFRSDNEDTIDFTMKPDGMFFTDEKDFIIELDMGTETSTQLLKKWSKYKNFFVSRSGRSYKKPLHVLFVLAETRNGKKESMFDNRKAIVRSTIEKSFQGWERKDFEISVGTHDEMLHALKTEFNDELSSLESEVLLDLRKKKWTIKKQKNSGGFWIEKRNEKGLIKKNGRVAKYHFLFENFDSNQNFFDMRSFPKKQKDLLFMKMKKEISEELNEKQLLEIFQMYYKVNRPFQVVVIKEDKIKEFYKKFNIYKLGNISESYKRIGEAEGLYFTTASLLKKSKEIDDALFTFHRNQIVFFEDGLVKRKKSLSLDDFLKENLLL